MQNTINTILSEYSTIQFLEDTMYFWSPKNREIHYKKSASTEADVWKLLHEIGHALLNHERFRIDIELIHMEIAAWSKAKQIAKKYDIEILDNHIQDCLDTYRDWLYRRSICPNCMSTGLQDTASVYRCINCLNTWRVSASRTCRTYRKNQRAPVAGAL
jgi:hypothetical protein